MTLSKIRERISIHSEISIAFPRHLASKPPKFWFSFFCGMFLLAKMSPTANLWPAGFLKLKSVSVGFEQFFPVCLKQITVKLKFSLIAFKFDKFHMKKRNLQDRRFPMNERFF